VLTLCPSLGRPYSFVILPRLCLISERFLRATNYESWDKGNILQTCPEIAESDSLTQRRNSRESSGLHGLDNVLENTISSVENFVDDSVSTVYARSTSGSEAS
jgi:hypothetical protein